MKLGPNFKPIFAKKSAQVRFLSEHEIENLVFDGVIEEHEDNTKVFHTPWNDALQYSDKTHFVICNVLNAHDAYPIEKDVFNKTYSKVGESPFYEKKEITQCYIYEGNEEILINTKEGQEKIVKGDVVAIDKDEDPYPIRNFKATYKIVNISKS